MKKSLLHTFLIGLAVILTACGGSGSSSTSSNDSTSSDTRTIKLSLNGDLSNVGGVVATKQSDGSKHRFTINETSRNALIGTGATATGTVPTCDPVVDPTCNNNVTIQVVNPADQPIVTVTPTNCDPAIDPTCPTVNTGNPATGGAGGGAPANLGNVTIPAGAGAGGTPTPVPTTTNPVNTGQTVAPTAGTTGGPTGTGGNTTGGPTGGNTTGGPTGGGGDDNGNDGNDGNDNDGNDNDGNDGNDNDGNDNDGNDNNDD